MNSPVISTEIPAAPEASAAKSVSPGRRVWLRFKKNRRGYWSLILFGVLVVISLLAELVSNDKPFIASYKGEIVFPMVDDLFGKEIRWRFRIAKPTISIPSYAINSRRMAIGRFIHSIITASIR